MTSYLLRRLGLLLITLWLMSVAIFVLTAVLPGDEAHIILGQFATPDAIAALHRQLHLDDPLPVRYLNWITGFLTGAWGSSPSNSNAPLRDLIPGRLGNSLILSGAALLVIVPISLLLGVVAALQRDRLLDRLISISALSLMAIPEFITGTVLLFAFGITLHWVPTDSVAGLGGSPLAAPIHLILPSLSLGLIFFGYLARMMRVSTISVLDSAYVRTALLKGLPRRQVLIRHVLRNALVPTLAVVAAQIGYLVGGLVVVEQLFDYPGIGTLLLNAGLTHDVPLLEDCVMIVAVIYMLSNILSDVLNAVLNPRIRFGAGGDRA